MEKKEKFMEWLRSEIDYEANNDVRQELVLLLEKCDSDMWEIRIKQRDVDNMTEIHISGKNGNGGSYTKPLANKMAATTRVLRKLATL